MICPWCNGYGHSSRGMWCSACGGHGSIGAPDWSGNDATPLPDVRNEAAANRDLAALEREWSPGRGLDVAVDDGLIHVPLHVDDGALLRETPIVDASSGGTSSDGRGVLCPTCAAAGMVCRHGQGDGILTYTAAGRAEDLYREVLDGMLGVQVTLPDFVRVNRHEGDEPPLEAGP